ncbi:LLM class F420-dependent oxidoreductase [Parafrankia colletiae]|uniref:LLM class F420-dependent oxidoreductase n=1 Tax=Parafrankia colletiae TaxID=573497 RepID=A0A1S1R6Q6_9ACTN|nr:LLM class F420-dependent oxidoreductase [Parafrankia colletiae]MCK9903247.1 LLM class F420-dependent oxidoreductase [Frankia sp. Cpl3]OHV41165.1 LLM class F420-dependent oxidoreductase [Parafrankia colletiae]
MDLRIFVEPQQGASYAHQLAVAQAAERLGFGAFFRSDHYLRIGSGSPLPGPTDAWTTLAAIGRETTTIRLGTLVTSATFRLPGPLALTVAQADEMSGGRVELGIGAGWYAPEHEAYGIPFPPVRERFDRLAEQLAIIEGLWRTPVGDTFTHHGQHYTLTDSPGLPKPVQDPHPPIIIGGSGRRRTPELAARHAAEFNLPFAPPAQAAAQFEVVREAAAAAGRDPAGLICSVALTLCCGRDEAEVRRRAERGGDMSKLDTLRERGLAGSPAEVLDRLAAYGPDGAGASRVYLQILDMTDLDHLALVAEEVLPHL